jgi:F0F1-type ATP synthase membrane subunit c/vacuolar-type H+-ATPase subunit K
VSPAVPTKEQANRVLRIVHIAFITVMFLQMYVLVTVRKDHQPPDPTMVYAIIAVALMMATACLAMRFFVLPKADEQAAAMEAFSPRRQTLYIIVFALCESIWLFGFVLSFVGEPLSVAITFLVIALVLMILCIPRRV